MPDGDRVQNGNIALLIDADNASASALDQTLTILAELGTVNVRRAYGNWTKPGLKSWIPLIQKHAIEPQQQFDVTKGKNATDMKMTIDAMDLLYSNRIEGFGIMSSDSDFMPIATRIRQNGLPVYGFGSSTRTPEGFREACTRFIDITVAGNPPGQPDVKPAASPKVDEDLVHLLGEAWKAAKREDGFANLSEVGKLVSARSSFDARSYGFSRLSDLVGSLDQFQIERRNGATLIKRVR